MVFAVVIPHHHAVAVAEAVENERNGPCYAPGGGGLKGATQHRVVVRKSDVTGGERMQLHVVQYLKFTVVGGSAQFVALSSFRDHLALWLAATPHPGTGTIYLYATCVVRQSHHAVTHKAW